MAKENKIYSVIFGSGPGAANGVLVFVIKATSADGAFMKARKLIKERLEDPLMWQAYGVNDEYTGRWESRKGGYKPEER